MRNQPEKLPHEMTDEELIADEASREAAAAKLFGAIEVEPLADADNMIWNRPTKAAICWNTCRPTSIVRRAKSPTPR